MCAKDIQIPEYYDLSGKNTDIQIHYINMITTVKNRKIIQRSVLLIITVMAAVLMILCQAATAFAIEGEAPADTHVTSQGVAGGAYEVTRYEIGTAVGKDHSYEVTETVSVNIPDALQKIEFAIPSGSFRIRGVEVEGYASTVKSSSDGSYLVIEDPAALSVGIHEYVIRYKILEFADRDSSRDIFYYNVLLPQWKQPIAEMSASVSFPPDFPMPELVCYSGQFGVADADNRITFTNNKSMRTVTIEGARLPENYSVTLKAELPDGYWEGALDGIWAIMAMVLIMGSVVLVLLVMWIIGGRDPKIKRMQQTRPIEGISPVEIGYAFNNKFSVRDLVRLIIYFGIKGNLRISEYEPKRYRLYRLNDPDGEERLIRNAYSILFEDVYKNRALDMEDLGERLQRIENAIRDDVAAGFSSTEMQSYTPLSRAFRIAGIILFGLGMAIANGLKYSYQYISINYAESIVYGLLAAGLAAALCLAVDRRDSSSGEIGRTMEVLVSLVLLILLTYESLGIIRTTGHFLGGLLVMLLAAISIFLIVIMRARGAGNAALVMKFRQLRRFIYHPTPKEILENYLADPGYYYDMLLYALTFGAEESWAISFITLDVPEPEWFSNDVEGEAYSNLRGDLTTVDYARDIRSFVRTIEGGYEEMQRRARRH